MSRKVLSRRKLRILVGVLGLSLVFAAAFSYRWYRMCQAQASKQVLAAIYQEGMYVADRPILSFSQKVFDFGTVDASTLVEHVYIFTNEGEKALIIHQVQGGCCSDCLTIEWPRKPIQIGERGEIKVRLNKEGQEGKKAYVIVVSANTDPPETRLLLKGVRKRSNRM